MPRGDIGEQCHRGNRDLTAAQTAIYLVTVAAAIALLALWLGLPLWIRHHVRAATPRRREWRDRWTIGLVDGRKIRDDLAERAAAAGRRAQELQDRLLRLGSGAAPSAEDAALAEQAAQAQHVRSSTAHRHASQAHLDAAAAHREAADALQAAGQLDRASEHRQNAAHHERAAGRQLAAAENEED